MMANVSLRASERNASPRRAAGVLLLGGLLFSLSVLAHAQAPGKADKTTGKADPKASDSKAADPKKTVPDPAFPASPGAGAASTDEAVKVINDLLAAKWKNDKGETLYTTAERCTDYEYIRRVSLDLIGRIAKFDEIQKFMGDVGKVGSSKARAMLVDRLLASPEYGYYWSRIWTHWLMTRTGEPLYKDQIQLWLEEEMFASDKEMSIKDMAEKLITATGRTNDNGAVNYLLANLGGEIPGPQRGKDGQFDMRPATSRTIRLFLGYQIQCTECHDHPFNGDWKQKHFWGVNAFFRQTEREGTPVDRNQGMMGMRQQLTLKNNAEYNKGGIVYFEKRNGVYLPSEPIFLDGARLPKNAQVSRRDELARFVTGHKNFSKAYINRMWAHLFGRGMTEKAVSDDFGDHNPVIQDELLERLGEMFSGSAGYNPKTLIRWVCASDAYQLKAVANKSNDKAEDEVFFSRQMLKAMSPEQLLESIIVATRPNVAKDDAEQKKFRAEWMSRLVVNFGDDEGNEGTFSGTVVQMLLMMNGRDVNNAISGQSGAIQSAMKLKTRKQIFDYLFLVTLNRPCTVKEEQQLMANIKLKNGIKENPNDLTPVLQDIFWALLNCNEFILNH